jgi:hypothetical protein
MHLAALPMARHLSLRLLVGYARRERQPLLKEMVHGIGRVTAQVVVSLLAAQLRFSKAA